MRKAILIIIALFFLAMSLADGPPSDVVTKTGTTDKTCNPSTGHCVMQIYSGLVNYHNGSEYVEINTTVVNSSDALYEYEVTTGAYEVYYKQDPTQGQVVKFVRDGYSITYQPMALNYRNQNNQLEQIQMVSSVTGTPDENYFNYPAAYGSGRDLRYIYHTEVLKEELVLQNKSVVPTPAGYILSGGNVTMDLDFIVATSEKIFINGLEWDKSTTTTTQDEVEIRNSSNATIYKLLKPYAYDNSTGEDYSPMPLTYEFKKQGNSLYVIVKTPYDWLNSTAVYPVRIDPPMILDEQSQIQDVYWAQSTANAHATDNLRIDSVNDPTGTGEITFIKFDISDIPATATVTNATLYMSIYIKGGIPYGGDSAAFNNSIDVWYSANQTWTVPVLNTTCASPPPDYNDTNIYCNNLSYFFTTKIYRKYFNNASDYHDNGEEIRFESLHSAITTELGNGNGNVTYILNNTGNQTSGILWTHSSTFEATEYRPYLEVTFTESVNPTYTAFINNGSDSPNGAIVNFSVNLADDLLDSYIFAHNQTGTLTNGTANTIGDKTPELIYFSDFEGVVDSSWIKWQDHGAANNPTITSGEMILSGGGGVSGGYACDGTKGCTGLLSNNNTRPTTGFQNIQFTMDVDVKSNSYEVGEDIVVQFSCGNFNTTPWYTVINVSDPSSSYSETVTGNASAVNNCIDNNANPTWRVWQDSGSTFETAGIDNLNITGTPIVGDPLSSYSATELLTVTIGKNNYVCGQYWFNDSSGNVNQTNQSCFTVANSAPGTPSVTYPVDDTAYNDIPYINYSATDADSDSLTYSVYINDTLNVTTTVNITDWNASDGYYEIKVSATDGTATSSNSTPLQFYLDTTAPTNTWHADTPADSSRTTGNSQLIKITYADANLDTCILEWDGTNETFTSSDATTYYETKSTTDGATYTINAYCNDTVGYVTAAGERSFTENNEPATPTLIYPTAGDYTSVTQVNYSSSDTDGDTLTYYFEVNTTLNTTSTANLSSWNISEGNWALRVRANDTYEMSSYSSTTTINIDSTGPSFSANQTNGTNLVVNDSIQLNLTITDNLVGLDGYILAHNGTGTFQNGTYVDISGNSYTMVENVSNVSSTRGEIFSWQVWTNDTLGNVNVSQVYTVTIVNSVPVATVLIDNKPLDETEDLNATITFTDADGDTWTLNETKWYNGSTEMTDYANLTSLSYTNTTPTETWKISARVWDGFNWSEWVNDTVTINDSFPPVINRIWTSVTSVFTTGSVTFNTNITDVNSPINANACKFTLSKSDYDSGNNFNLTTNSKSGDVVSVTSTMSPYGTGILEFKEAHCEDASSNKVTNLTVGINITISTAPVGGGSSGGGGGGSTPVECTLDEDCSKFGLSFYCVENKCLKLEREDIAEQNLRALGLPDNIITQLLQKGGGVCNWDGICSQDLGEDRFNCGTEDFPDPDGGTIVVQGDCTGLEIQIPKGFLLVVGIVAIVIIILLNITKKKKGGN